MARIVVDPITRIEGHLRIEAEIDGVRGRKLGRLWRVTLSCAWTVPTTTRARVVSPPSQSMRDDRERTRS